MRPSISAAASTSRHRGFTLVELLVVVGIIALLVAMLLPSLGRAKALTASARCKSNLNQVWKMLHGSSDQKLAINGWTQVVHGRGGAGALRCPMHSIENTGAGRVIITGGNVREIPPPPSVVFNSVESNTAIHSYSEREGYVLPVSVNCDITTKGTYENSSLSPGTIPAGTAVDCYFLFFDPVESQNVTSSGSVTFGAEIIGIICLDGSLDATDPALGRPGTSYPTGQSARGYEMGAERVTLEPDMRTLTIHNYHSTFPGENARILTVPGGASSYGMNRKVPPVGGRPQQLLLLDYDNTFADPDTDTDSSGRMQYISLRHLDKANGVLLDGSVHSFTEEDLRPDGPLWQP